MVINLKRVLPFLILLITLSSVSQWASISLGGTYLWWTVYALVILLFIRLKRTSMEREVQSDILVLKLYFIWNLICIIRGVFVADDYWQWKNLIGAGMVLMLPLSIFVSTDKHVIKDITKTWIRFGLPAFIIMLPFLQGEAYGRFLVPIGFLMLFWPLASMRWKLIILAFALVVLVGDFTARSNIIKMAAPLLLCMLYPIRRYLSTKFLELGRVVLMLMPFVFFMLAINNSFNVFQLKDYADKSYTTSSMRNGERVEVSLTDDTRTFLYQEVIGSAIKYDYVLLGRTPARGNESAFWYDYSYAKMDVVQKERFTNEVSILNVFTWTGLLGVVLYFLVFFRASWLAVNRSNNFIMKMVGLYVAFRWDFAWVEDFSRFDLSYIFLWLTIGICYSGSFRAMNDNEIRDWVRQIFRKQPAPPLIRINSSI